MRADQDGAGIAVFDFGGTWFRWGRYARSAGLLEWHRAPAVTHLSHPHLSADELQRALTDFLLERTREMRHSYPTLRSASISVGAAVNAHDGTILGSGPLWGPTAKPLRLYPPLEEALPELEWHVVNDITATLARFMEEDVSFRKTLLITISTGIGSRLFDHSTRRIPYDPVHGVQGEIGHLALAFELEGKVIARQCECGGWNHLNAFSSGRGIAKVLRHLPTLSSSYQAIVSEPPESWIGATDEHRLAIFKDRLNEHNGAALDLLDALVTPVARTLATALSLDPEIGRIVVTGGVAQGLGHHYRQALLRTFMRDGLYQITSFDPDYLAKRLHWDEEADLGGLIGAGIYAEAYPQQQKRARN